MHSVDCNCQLEILQAYEAVECFAASTMKLNCNCECNNKKNCVKSLIKNIFFFVFREAASIPLQQIPYFQPATQQKGRPRKRKPLQSDETIINTNSNIPHDLLHENRLGKLKEYLKTRQSRLLVVRCCEKNQQ